jgi:hypothetical protein
MKYNQTLFNNNNFLDQIRDKEENDALGKIILEMKLKDKNENFKIDLIKLKNIEENLQSKIYKIFFCIK